jgi:hypothetical protein
MSSIFHVHVWGAWEKEVNFVYGRYCQTCNEHQIDWNRKWPAEDIAAWEKEQEEKRQQQNIERLNRLRVMDAQHILDRRGEQLFSNSHIWYEGAEYLITDFHYTSNYTGNLQLFPANRQYSSCYYSAFSSQVVKLP